VTGCSSYCKTTFKQPAAAAMATAKTMLPARVYEKYERSMSASVLGALLLLTRQQQD
jgi:hypothetical protein